MKNLFCFLMFALFFLTICTAQNEVPTPPTPPTPSEAEAVSSIATTINFSDGKNKKLRLKVDEKEFNLNLDFKKIKTGSIQKLITRYLGQSKTSFLGGEEWSDDAKTYRIRLFKGCFKASVDKTAWSAEDYQDFLSFASDVLEEIGWDVNLDKY